MATVDNSTQVVTSTESGTGWSVDVTNANLDPLLTLKDFIVRFDNVVQNNVDFTKTSQTIITYNGSAIPSSTVTIQRDTPNERVKCLTFGDRLQSAEYEAEFNRVHKLINENELSKEVRVTLADTTPGTLEEKTDAGADIALTVLNPGANEQLRISYTGAAVGDPHVDINSTGTSANAVGADAIAIGVDSVADGTDSIVIGNTAITDNADYAVERSLVIGSSSSIDPPADVTLTGTVTLNATTAVVGAGTLFTTELVSGNLITVSGQERTVNVITDNLNLTVTSPFGVSGSGLTIELTEGDSCNDSVVIGSNITHIRGDDSVLIGNGASGGGGRSTAIGLNAFANNSSFALGENTNAQASSSIAIGGDATATGASGIAIGNNSQAGAGPTSLAIGVNSVSSGAETVALGPFTLAAVIGGVAIGDGAISTETHAIAIGESASATETDTIAIGFDADVNDSTGITLRSVAIGFESSVTGTASDAVALGASANVTANNSIQLGTGTNSTTSTLQFLGNTLANANGLVNHLINQDITSGIDITVTPGVSNDRLFVTPTANINLILLTAGATNTTHFTFVNLDPGSFNIDIKIDLVGNPTELVLGGGITNISVGYTGTDYRFYG